MFDYIYKIADCKIHICSEIPLQQDRWSALFGIHEQIYQKEIFCVVKLCKTLPDFAGNLLAQTPTMRLYRDGDVLWQELLALSDGRVLARAHYSAVGNGEIHLYLKGREQPWINRMPHIWAGMDIGYQLLWENRLLLHSASVCVGERAILFAGPSGIGKTTQARLWQKYREARILNGDKNILGITVQRPEILTYGAPFCGTSGICHNYKMPLEAIVFLHQGMQNEIRQIKGREALVGILENSMGHPGAAEASEKILELAGKVAERCPLFSLTCTPDREAVEVLEKALITGR